MIWKVLQVIYFLFKATIITGLIVGIGSSQQCNNQLVEICQLAGACDY